MYLISVLEESHVYVEVKCNGVNNYKTKIRDSLSNVLHTCIDVWITTDGR